MMLDLSDDFFQALPSALQDCSDQSLYRLALKLTGRLRQQQRMLAAAESCSGGWIAKAITDVPGCSDVFSASVVTYSNYAKSTLLGVSNATLQAQGAVSQAVVEEMAAGVQRLLGTSCAVAVSGVAGPGGGSAEKPVGTVWICWRVDDQSIVRKFLFAGDRENVRRCTCSVALAGLDLLLQSLPA